MTVGDRILQALEANDPGAGDRVSAPELEPVVLLGGNAEFGLTLNNKQSVAELQDIMASWAFRMKQLGDSYAAFAPIWQTRDPIGFSDWTTDYAKLQNRYNAALAKAQSAVTAAKFDFTVPNSMIEAQDEYDALSKAMRQCYPPDGCPVQKGDFDDLTNRLAAATTAAATPSLAPSYAGIPQPTATDAAGALFSATGGLDALAMVRGDQKPQGVLGAALQGAGLTPDSKPPAALDKAKLIVEGITIGGLGAFGFSVAGPYGAGAGALLGLGLLRLLGRKSS